MKMYVAGRNSGKTMISIYNAAFLVLSGSEVYIVSASKSQCDYAKKMAEKVIGKDVASKIHYVTGYEIFSGKLIGGYKRKSIKIIFDDLDLTLNQIVKDIFGAESNIELVTTTFD